jgi:hypothetical protein
MISVKKHIDSVLNNILSVTHIQPYYNLIIKTIEEQSKIKFTPKDIVIMSSAEHFSVFNHYKTFSNILTIASYSSFWKNHESENIYLVILADSLIPMDNADYPRGIVLNSSQNELHHYPLFSKKYRKSFPLYMNNSGIKSIDIDCGSYPFNQSKILHEINMIFNCQDTFFNQVSDTNTFLYNKMLHNVFPKPQLLYLSLEKTVIEILIKLLKMNDFFCDEFIINNHERTYNALSETRTCWGNNKGSFLFWHCDEGKLIPCKLEKKNIISEKKKFLLQQEELIGYLETGQLMPGGFLSLAIAAILPNFATIGGIPQSLFLLKMIDYIDTYYRIGISRSINNYNWGIHPEIMSCVNGKVHISTSVYLAANPLTAEQLDYYLNNINIQYD